MTAPGFLYKGLKGKYMKVDRRSFLSFVIGGAAGTALSPLPWKLMDDSSIWSQNWAWTPVPADGESIYENTTCSLCPGGCGLSVRKIDNRAIKIEGIKGHPVNDGSVCILGLSSLQYLYGPTRVKSPMKREGERGRGKWRKISWDEAIAEIAEKLGKMREEGNAHSLAWISGSDRGTVPGLMKRFLTAYGSPNFIRTPSGEDAHSLAMKVTMSEDARIGYDMENADFILSFGSGLIEGWGSPVRVIKANSALKEKKAKMIQVEPRLSNTAAKADKWVPVNPGTEADLAFGIAAVLISESLYDAKFVKYNTAGFDQWKDILLKQYDPQSVADATGVSVETLTDIARAFANASRPIAVCGRGKGNTPGSLREFSACYALNALKGNINQTGGISAVPNTDYVQWADVETDDIARAGLRNKRIDGAGSGKYKDAAHLLNRFAEAVEKAETYPIEALFVAGANPCFSMPDSEKFNKAVEKIPFVVSFSSFMDETAQKADLILPDHFFLEKYEDVPSGAGVSKPMIGLSRPVVSPQFNTKHLGETILLMAAAMGGEIENAFPWEDYESCLAEALGDKWDGLLETGVWVQEDFQSKDGSFTFVAADAEPVEPEGDVNTYPLIFLPYDSMRITAGYLGNAPFMVKTIADTVIKHKDGYIEINPETAAALGLSEGDAAVLTTPKGKASVRIHLFDGIKPGVAAMPRGLGHTAYDNYLAAKGVNVNTLIGPVEDPFSGYDAAWGIRAKLAKA